ncbi:MAG TPA: hypothetical protein VI796_00470 [Candidatus Thermoplasmatota archaeon]|nr:hypothetical protein [Candidatus Thermoplasmatota archaeon]
MALLDALRRVGKAFHADVEEAPGEVAFELVIARRLAGRVAKQLRYRVRLEADDGEHTVYFSEVLWERDDGRGGLDLTPRFGAREEAFRVAREAESAALDAQVALFELRYGARLDFAPLRKAVAEACRAEGYELRHLVPLE